MYVLRRTYGAWSQGTRVDCHVDGEEHRFSILGEDVPFEDVVKRRDMTRYGPAINSRERRRRERAVKKALGINVS